MKRDTDETTKQFPATPVEVEDAILAGLTKAMNSAAGRMDLNLTIGHNSYPRNRRGWAIVRSSALLLTAQAATSREDASSEQSLALMIDWEFDTTAAAEGLRAKLRDLWARPWQDCYAEPRGLDRRKNQGLSDTRIAGP